MRFYPDCPVLLSTSLYKSGQLTDSPSHVNAWDQFVGWALTPSCHDEQAQDQRLPRTRSQRCGCWCWARCFRNHLHVSSGFLQWLNWLSEPTKLLTSKLPLPLEKNMHYPFSDYKIPAHDRKLQKTQSGEREDYVFIKNSKNEQYGWTPLEVRSWRAGGYAGSSTDPDYTGRFSEKQFNKMCTFAHAYITHTYVIDSKWVLLVVLLFPFGIPA